jgi:hypothetical protein
MESNLEEKKCQVCHQPILPTYYFCPNCGVALTSAPLSTSIVTQIGIYLFSIILPMIAFLFITRWPGLKYSKSSDIKARWVGIIAWVLLISSSVITYWLIYIELQQFSQSLNDILNTDLGTFGL